MSITDKPLAAHGLTSYRYKGRYGWIMIGARTNDDALNEASRSTGGMTVPSMLQVWNGKQYVQVQS